MYTLISTTSCLLTEIDIATTRSHAHCIQLILLCHRLFNRIATPCLLVNFPDSTMMWPCCVSHISLLWRHVSEMSIASHSISFSSLNTSSRRSLEFSDLVFFCKTMNVVFFCAVFRFGHEVRLLCGCRHLCFQQILCWGLRHLLLPLFLSACGTVLSLLAAVFFSLSVLFHDPAEGYYLAFFSFEGYVNSTCFILTFFLCFFLSVRFDYS